MLMTCVCFRPDEFRTASVPVSLTDFWIEMMMVGLIEVI